MSVIEVYPFHLFGEMLALCTRVSHCIFLGAVPLGVETARFNRNVSMEKIRFERLLVWYNNG